MYRFRTINNLLGKNAELENQEIYFASPEELNDPMEGYRDIFWSGDVIVWRNFLKNYVRCLEHVYGQVIVLKTTKKLTGEDIPVLPYSHFPNNNFQSKLLEQAYFEFFGIDAILNLPRSLAKRVNPIRRDELTSFLKIIHYFALDALSKVYLDNGLIIKKPFTVPIDISELSKLIAENDTLSHRANDADQKDKNLKKTPEKLFLGINLYSNELDLIRKYNLQKDESQSNQFFLISEFPEFFLTTLESSIYPNWYSASFLSECTNSAVWGHYGDNHQGVCLKFKSISNETGLEINLKTEYGYSSGPIIGMRPHKFVEIKYHNKHPEIDFFRSIGRLSPPLLNHLWYADEKGNMSICGEHLNTDREKWRDKYWENFTKSISIKLEEWDYEKEFRLIIHGDFIDYSEKNKRKLEYDFNDLEGIIFGIKTKTSDKISIMRIIEDKCKKYGRKEFAFYQAYYSKLNGKIETKKLNLLKFE